MDRHKIAIEAHAGAVRVSWRGQRVAETTRAKRLREGSYAPVWYIPIEDAEERFLSRSEHRTHCPFKGDASYYHLTDGSARDENAVWVYEAPVDAAAPIRNHIAFHADRVTIESEA